jgi:hypothetical protein
VRADQAAQALHVNVKKLAGSIALVPHWWRRSIELFEPTQTSRTTNARGRRRANSDDAGDLSNGQPLSAESKDS